jgi:hypothetical protein
LRDASATSSQAAATIEETIQRATERAGEQKKLVEQSGSAMLRARDYETAARMFRYGARVSTRPAMLLFREALAPLIQEFVDDGPDALPVGRCWDALGELCDDLQRRAIERFRAAPRGSLVARALTSIGLRERPAPDLSDLARLEGYQDALVDLRGAVLLYVRAARQAQRGGDERRRVFGPARAAHERVAPMSESGRADSGIILADERHGTFTNL